MATWTWNPADNANFTLSGGNLTATGDGSAGHNDGCRATNSINLGAGKWYWEITNANVGTYGAQVGIIAGGTSLTGNTIGGNNYIFQWGPVFASNPAYFNGFQNQSAATNWSGASTPGAGDVVMVAYDAAGGKLWFGLNGTWFNSSSTANPATGADPRFSGITTAVALFPAVAGYFTPVFGATANFGVSPFVYSPPAGFAGPAVTVDLAGAGLLSISVSVALAVNARFLGAGNLSASTIQTMQSAATLNGVGSLSGAAVYGLAASLNFAGTGNLSAFARLALFDFATFSGSGNLSFAAAVSQKIAATLAGAGSLSATTSIAIAALASLAGAGNFSISTTAGVGGFATFPGSGNLSALVALSQLGTASLLGESSLSASVKMAIAAPTTFLGSGNMSATALIGFANGITFNGLGVMSAYAYNQAAAQEILAGSGSLFVTVFGTILEAAVFAGAGDLYAFAYTRIGRQGPTNNRVVPGPGITEPFVVYGRG